MIQAYSPTCLICRNPHKDMTIEHIVPRALGNVHYILPKGKVCGMCNSRFSKYENSVLSSPSWLSVRKKYHNSPTSVLPGKAFRKNVELKRFLMKMFYEAMYHSRSAEFHSLDLEYLRLELCGYSDSQTKVFENKQLSEAREIPNWINRWRLRRNHISLRYYCNDHRILFEFRYRDIFNVLECNTKI